MPLGRTDSNYAFNFGLKGTISAVPSFDLLLKCHEVVQKIGFESKVKFGQIFSSDVFYKDCPDTLDWAKMGCIGVEMESYGLFLNAARAGKKALTLSSVSDSLVTKEVMTAEERSKGVDDMIILGQEIAACLD